MTVHSRHLLQGLDGTHFSAIYIVGYKIENYSMHLLVTFVLRRDYAVETGGNCQCHVGRSTQYLPIDYRHPSATRGVPPLPAQNLLALK